MLKKQAVQLTGYDLDFIVQTASSGTVKAEQLKTLVREDDHFRKAMIGDAQVSYRVMGDEEVFVRISPGLYFEVLLREAIRHLQSSAHTIERTGSQTVAVFDAKEVLDYLAAMLASFTRVNTYSGAVRLKPRVWRRYRMNDMDIDSLIRLCANTDGDGRIAYYKRIADVCLFEVGIFPEHATFGYR